MAPKTTGEICAMGLLTRARCLSVLQKNPKLRTVVNKLGNINAIFRTFDMEVIAGDDDLIAEVVRGSVWR